MAETDPSGALGKKAFGAALGISPARVSQLVDKGLPVRPDGKVDLAEGRAWYLDNVDTGRRRTPAVVEPAARTARAELDRTKADREALKLAQERGRLVDREAAERAVFERARAERDRWIGWTNRAAADLAAVTGASPSLVYAELDRLVRDHIALLAETPMRELVP